MRKPQRMPPAEQQPVDGPLPQKNRHQRRAESRSRKFLVRAGELVAVVRPENPRLAMRLAQEAIDADDMAQFERILMQQKYTFLGYAARDDGEILDGARRVIGTVADGDSLLNIVYWLEHFEKPAVACSGSTTADLWATGELGSGKPSGTVEG